VLRTLDASLIDDVSQQPELAPIGALAHCHAACLIPLRAALRTYGLS